MKNQKRKKVVRLLALNINERDLSIGLVGLKQYANLDETVRANFNIHLHQWTKNYANKGQPGTVDGLHIDTIVEYLDPQNTDIFGFSTYIWNFDFMMAVAKRIKEINPKAITLFGGSQGGGMGEKLFDFGNFIDYVIRGEAEESFRDFLLGFLTGDYSRVNNLFYRSGNRVRCNVPSDPKLAKKQSYLRSIEQLPYPFRDTEYREYLDDLNHQVTAQIETERGCPLACAFCSWGTQLPIRRRRQEDVEEGLTYLLNHPNVQAVYIIDANPFIHNNKGFWLTDFLLNHNKTGKPVFFELNPEYIKDPRLIENLGKLSSDELAFGLQSTSDQTLKTINRKFDRNTYERNVRTPKKMNPDANIKFSLIVGLPGDNYQSFAKSLEFVIDLAPADIYIHDLLVLPGSEMFENPAAYGLTIDKQPSHRVIENKTFPRHEYNRAKRIGYYAKLLHKYRWLSECLLELKERTMQSSVELYSNFADLMEQNGLHGFSGQAVDEIGSEEFDYLTQSFSEQPDNEIKLKHLFQEFKDNL